MEQNRLLKAVFGKFERHKVSYCIIRNYEFLDENRPYDGKDVDVLVSSRDADKASEQLISCGFAQIDLNPASHHKGFVALDGTSVVSVHLHVGGISGRNIRYLPAGPILARRVKEGFFYRAADEDKFRALVLHILLDGRSWRDSYRKEAQHLAKRLYDGVLSGIFSGKTSAQVVSMLRRGEFTSFDRQRKSFRNEYFARRPLVIFCAMPFAVTTLAWGIKRIFSHGRLVSIVGLDGTGKTTASEGLQNILGRSLVRTSSLYLGRGKDNILPIQFLASLFMKKKSRNGTSPSIGKKKAFSPLLTASSALFFLDLLLRYLFVAYPKKVRNDVVIADRYATDLMLMNGVPLWLRKLYAALLPKPDLVVYLHQDLEVLHGRKHHPMDDLKRQSEIYETFLPSLHPVRIKSEGIEKTRDAILSKVMGLLRD